MLKKILSSGVYLTLVACNLKDESQTSNTIGNKFPTNSQQIPNKFPTNSQQIPNKFPTNTGFSEFSQEENTGYSEYAPANSGKIADKQKFLSKLQEDIQNCFQDFIDNLDQITKLTYDQKKTVRSEIEKQKFTCETEKINGTSTIEVKVKNKDGKIVKVGDIRSISENIFLEDLGKVIDKLSFLRSCNCEVQIDPKFLIYDNSDDPRNTFYKGVSLEYLVRKSSARKLDKAILYTKFTLEKEDEKLYLKIADEKLEVSPSIRMHLFMLIKDGFIDNTTKEDLTFEKFDVQGGDVYAVFSLQNGYQLDGIRINSDSLYGKLSGDVLPSFRISSYGEDKNGSLIFCLSDGNKDYNLNFLLQEKDDHIYALREFIEFLNFKNMQWNSPITWYLDEPQFDSFFNVFLKSLSINLGESKLDIKSDGVDFWTAPIFLSILFGSEGGNLNLFKFVFTKSVIKKIKLHYNRKKIDSNDKSIVWFEEDHDHDLIELLHTKCKWPFASENDEKHFKEKIRIF